MDFTLKTYRALLRALLDNNYTFLPYNEFCKGLHTGKTVTLRHDVDVRKYNSLKFAKIQNELGIRATYYFRVVPVSYNESLIKEIAALGHEIGYHYETMDTSRGDVDAAYREFCHYLEMFRKFVPVNTICMHGSPLSNYDNREIWKKYNYRQLGVIAEPYFDMDFNKTFYLTDTGRRWDGSSVSVRDKAMDSNACNNPDFLKLRFHSTTDIISGIKKDILPHQVMMTFHPQRWLDNKILWCAEILVQIVKNTIKGLMIRRSK